VADWSRGNNKAKPAMNRNDRRRDKRKLKPTTTLASFDHKQSNYPDSTLRRIASHAVNEKSKDQQGH
jgi:hypothetical protein